MSYSRLAQAVSFATLRCVLGGTGVGIGRMAIDMSEYAKGIADQIADIKKHLAPLEAGEMKLGERIGSGPWTDVTQEAIDREKRAIATYEAILSDIKAKGL